MQNGPGPAAMLHIVVLRLHEEGQAEVPVDAPVSLPKIRLPVCLATLAKVVTVSFSRVCVSQAFMQWLETLLPQLSRILKYRKKGLSSP